MAKLPHQSTVEPVNDRDAASKSYADTSGGGGSANFPSKYAVEFGNPSNNSAHRTDATFDIPTDVTVECWFKPNSISATYSTLMGKGRTSSLNNNYALQVNNAGVKFQARSDADAVLDVTEATSVTVDQWDHWAATREGASGDTKIFKNGVQLGTTTTIGAGATLDQSSDEFRLGSEALQTTPIEDGRIFEARVWNVVRTPTEIAANYQKALGGSEAGLVAYYKFADQSFVDSGPNGLDLTAAGSPTFEIDAPFALPSADTLKTANGLVDVSGATAPTTGQVLTAVDGSSANWQTLPAGGAADALSTTGADVDVSAADPPTVGQALVATSPTAAEWQNVATGAVAGAQGSYLVATTSGTPTIPATGVAVPFDTVVNSRGGLSLAASKVSGLKAGRTYMINAVLRAGNFTVDEFILHQVYDVTGAAFIGSLGLQSAEDRVTDFTNVPQCAAVFTPTVDSEIEIRINGSDGGTGILTAQTRLTVVEIGAVQAEVVGGLEFMDIINVTADGQTFEFNGTGGDGALGRSLDGEVDGGYVMAYVLPDPGAIVNVELRPNGLDPTVATDFEGARNYSGTSDGGVVFDAWQINGQNTGFPEIGSVEIPSSETGRVRGFVGKSSLAQDGGSSWANVYAGTWFDTATAITSLQIRGSTATAIKAGAQFTLWRRSRNNLRADTAAVYERNVEAVVDQGTNAETDYTTGAATFGGSLLGVSARLVDDTVTAGSITVNAKVGGVTVLTATLDTTNTTFHRAADIVGAQAVAFGDDIEVGVSTTGLTTTGAGSPAVSVNLMLANDAYVQPRKGPDYLMAARQGSNQTLNVGVNNHLEFNVHSSRGDSITISTGAGQAAGIITVQPGKLYEIHVEVSAVVNEGHSQSRLVQHPSDVALVGISGTNSMLHRHIDNVAHDTVSTQSSVLVIAPTVETSFKLDITTNVNFTQWNVGSRIWIKELK